MDRTGRNALERKSEPKESRSLFSMDCEWSKDGRQLCFLFPWPWWAPILHSRVFTYDMGRCFPSGLTPSYLTDVLWGWMKLCIQCFQFLEKNYLWTFWVLHRYVSDLSLLLTVILVCCFYLLYKTTLKCHGHLRRLSELWASLLCTWLMWGKMFLGPQRMSPLQLTRWSGSHGTASGSRSGRYPWILQPLRKKASDFHTPRSQRSRWWSDVIRLPFVLLARVHGLVLGILKMNFVIGPYADFARQFTFFAFNLLLRANGCSISTLTSEALVHIDSLPLCSLGVR